MQEPMPGAERQDEAGLAPPMAPWLARALRDSAELRSALPSERTATLARIAEANGSSPLTVRTYSAIARRFERLRHRDPAFAESCSGMPIPLLKKVTSIHERSPSAARRIAEDWRSGIVNSGTPYIGSSRGDRRSLARIEDLECRLEEAHAAIRAANRRGSGRPNGEEDSLHLARAMRSAEARQAELDEMRRLSGKLLEENASLRAENASLREMARKSKAKSAKTDRALRAAYKNGMSPGNAMPPGERTALLLSSIAAILAHE